MPLGSPGQATVLLFTAADCPISDRYAPEVRRLAARFAADGVRVWLVYANAGETPAAARAHATAFGYGCRSRSIPAPPWPIAPAPR